MLPDPSERFTGSLACPQGHVVQCGPMRSGCCHLTAADSMVKELVFGLFQGNPILTTEVTDDLDAKTQLHLYPAQSSQPQV